MHLDVAHHLAQQTRRLGGRGALAPVDAHDTVARVERTRREPIFRVLITEAGNVEVNGSGRAATYAKNFEAVGIKSLGLLRITTDAEVLEQNAGFSRASTTPGYTQYDWRRRNLTDPPPRFVARLSVDPRTGIPAYRGSDSN